MHHDVLDLHKPFFNGVMDPLRDGVAFPQGHAAVGADFDINIDFVAEKKGDRLSLSWAETACK